MSVAELIEAKLNGTDFEEIYQTVRSGRARPSSLPQEQVEFLESMLGEVRNAVEEFEAAVKSDDLTEIKRTCESLDEIFQMVSDSCESPQ